jgi:hypothetical protein
MRLKGDFRINLHVSHNPRTRGPRIPTGAAAPNSQNPSKIKRHQSGFINPTNESRASLPALPRQTGKDTRAGKPPEFE